MANSRESVTTIEIINSWNRKKYTSFQEYLSSDDYKEFVGKNKGE